MVHIEKYGRAARASSTAPGFLSRLRDWWQRHGELDALDRDELERIAGDLGMTGWELKHAATRGPDAARLLYERMRALSLTKVDVEQVAHGLMRDLERTCAWCNKKRACERDLAARPGDRAWEGYCPNAVALTDVKTCKANLSRCD